MEKDLRKNLYENLKQYRGAFKEVAKRSGVHYRTVWRVLMNGDQDHNDVISVAAEVLKERKQKQQSNINLMREAVQLAVA